MFTGYVESYAMKDLDFETQRRTFSTFGYAVDPSKEHNDTRHVVGDRAKAALLQHATITDNVPRDQLASAAERKKRVARGDAANPHGFLGPWAGYEGETARVTLQEPTEEELALIKAVNEGTYSTDSTRVTARIGNEMSIFHGKEERDYLGRTYLSVPTDVGTDLSRDPGDREAFPPKKLLHTWYVCIPI
jgi:pre-mRNA-processing factor 17